MAATYAKVRHCPFCGCVPPKGEGMQLVEHPSNGCLLGGWSFNKARWNARAVHEVPNSADKAETVETIGRIVLTKWDHVSEEGRVNARRVAERVWREVLEPYIGEPDTPDLQAAELDFREVA